MQVRDKLYINGAWVAPHGKGSIDVHAAATEEVIARIPEGDAADADAAVAAARGAFDAWSATAPADRAAFLAKINEGLKARSDEIGRTIAQEVGMPLKLATKIQAGSPTFDLRHVREDARATSGGRRGSATRWWCASRWASSPASRRGTTRCTRSPPRSRRRSRPAAPWC